MKRCVHCGRPTALDEFAGEGGAGEGYRRAGFCVTAVDNDRARLDLYPLPDCQGAGRVIADAVTYLYDHGRSFALAHMSPTCTGYSRGTAAIPDRLEKYDRLIPVVRDIALELGVPYIIENVEDAGPELRDPLLLCWSMFHMRNEVVLDADGEPLRMERHRLFESNLKLTAPRECHHPAGISVAGSYGGSRRAKRAPGETLAEIAPRDRYEAKHVRKGGYVPRSLQVQRTLLGAPWMSAQGCKLSIPPFYTTCLGNQAIHQLAAVAA